jgi:hypothetical protein
MVSCWEQFSMIESALGGAGLVGATNSLCGGLKVKVVGVVLRDSPWCGCGPHTGARVYARCLKAKGRILIG